MEFKKVLDLIKTSKFVDARNLLIEEKSVDIAQFLEEVDRDKMLIIFRILPKDIATEVFSYMSTEDVQYIIEAITDDELSHIVDKLFLDDTIDILEELPANVVKKVLKNTKEGKRRLINTFLNYPDNSAGSIMTIEYVRLRKEMTVKEAVDHIKRTGLNKETIDTCYVTNEKRKLEGVLSIRDLILNDDNEIIKNIMDDNVICTHTLDDQEEVADLFKKYDFLAMPVVDNENRLVGIITIDDIVDIIEQENTEDFQKMAAMGPSEEEYLKTSVLNLAKNRIVWLLVLMISATFTGSIIKRYDEVLQSVVILAAFIPMLMDTGGNAGSQASTLVIRGLALGEIELTDIFKVLWKELRVSVVVGIVLSGVNFLRVYFLEKVELYVAITVCTTLFFTVVIAKVVGCVLPIVAKKLKLDPAIMASPLITTIVDALALIIYFGMAAMFLGI
ncbi:magnesium transporter [Clostridium argentinense CDC 2741]|uniref:Magnesium transporter MgtE n=1 Tax=Clostridium argentinense CDC 2741 TaxID=1418104 RepID=A0A0C1U9W6_9CLOT|nr:magnesium transporter [Clostridium argentinense]ARC83248.1 magnesium transporter [Clostridium argentinense]KIE48448.1 magnesium transporter [Clostridium argentinense CDC 2741]NFF41732.1 magnesium transporter [Clostridium argentinense]NFP52434.1 magnesium transporter [Clostridium argentinense]NFP74749.1 magnesium transporter [Clostridium argentinense]